MLAPPEPTPRVQVLLALVALSFAAAACHAPGANEAPKPRPGQVVLDVSAGATVATLVRATRHVVRVALYLDAGSRDGSVPQLATIAAWLAAARSGNELQVQITPDTSELARSCDSAQLEACIGQLRRALDARNPSDDELATLRGKLREARRRALAQDPQRRADAAALGALLGDEARGFFALGEADGDAAIDVASVNAFLQAHYGPGRALIVAAGEIEPERVQAAVAKAFAGATQATQARTARGLTASADVRVAALVDDRDALSIALAHADEASARSVALALQDVSPELQLSGDAFRVRGGALAILRVRASDLRRARDLLLHALTRFAVEPPLMAAERPEPDDVEGLSRALSRRWSATADPAGPRTIDRFEFGIGALIKGGRGDTPKRGDPSAELAKRAEQELRDQLARAKADVEPATRGSIDEHAASVVTSNGARVEVRSQASTQVAIAVRSAVGAGEDPPLVHGRSALLATLTTTACAGFGPERLQAELDALGATLTPRVDGDSYGLVLVLPRARWREGVTLALACMQSPSTDPVHFAAAVLRLQTRLASHAGELALRANVAALIAPRAPGLCAPWGHPALLGNVSSREVLGLLQRAATGARTAVAVFGEVPVREAVARIARRVALLPAGSLPRAVDAGAPVMAPAATMTSGVELHVLVTWRGPSTADELTGRAAASVSAAVLATALSRMAGLRVEARESGAFASSTWAALRIAVAPEAVPALATLLDRAGASVNAKLIEEALALALQEASDQDARAGSQLETGADRLARERLGSANTKADASTRTKPSEQAQRAIDALLRVTPIFVSLD